MPSIFSRRQRGTAPQNAPPMTENVRRADGSITEEVIQEFPQKIDLNAAKGEKSEYYVSENPITPSSITSGASREDSVGNFQYGKSYARGSVDMMPGYDEDDEQSEPSIRMRRKWKSSRFAPGEVYEKPWKQEKIPRKSWERLIFAFGLFVGAAIGGWLMYSAWSNVTNSEYCMILNDNFSSIDTEIWNYEVQRGGFGTGSFEWTTTDEDNVYVDGKGLHLVPTLTTDTTNITTAQLINGYTLNLTTDGTCTSDVISDCGIRSNATSGAIINPVRSGRINTQGKRTIKYGRVEVVAKIPKGDWLWPAIWMMPQDNVYGTWPQSGEIDIMEARGNSPSFAGGGRNEISSTLHWGPNVGSDAYWRTTGIYTLPRTDYSDEFHLYGLEWSSKYLFCYLDSRLVQVFFLKWQSGTSMWNKGEFGTNMNQSALNDPWSYTGRPNTPFDQEFYLILNVAVGGTNGFFYDSLGNKPWVNNNEAAPRAFWDAVDTWLPTWGEGDSRGMTVQSVKMYSLGACGTTTTATAATTLTA